ncbi:DNA polymerase subunit gamma-1 [Lamellibrachia satsuma]|nr:DNA polymerase subunit gamma-1 [Lamellibrachia satsuma]
MLATKQTKPYFEQAELVANMSLPPRPRKWVFRKGWTKYDPITGTCVEVVYPEDEALVFDVEVLMSEGNFPTLAVAVSPKAWYSWCSDRLVEDCFKWKDQRPTTGDLIPLETARGATKPVSGTWQPKLVIGHNVSFDRTFIKEQYYIKGPKTRFLDTMSMHIATSGQTGFQRMLYIARKKNSRRKEVRELEENQWGRGPPSFEWAEESTLNNLNDVYQLHCKGAPLDKETRQVFVKGDMKDVREDFQNLMIYCANDVKATLAVFQSLWPTFLERFPHPVTLAGMLEMGTAFLPVNSNWDRYIAESDAIHDDLQRESQLSLTQLANDACSLLEDKRYQDDVWLWDLDWSTKENTYSGPRTKKI